MLDSGDEDMRSTGADHAWSEDDETRMTTMQFQRTHNQM